MKAVFRILFVCMLCSLSFVANAQVHFTSGQGIVLGEETYTPLTFGKEWSIEEYEGGLNFWRRYPSVNWGNYKLFIDKTGKVGIGKKPSAQMLEVNGNAHVTGSYLTSSDFRLKSDIKSLSGCLGKVGLLAGKSYMKSSMPFNKQEEVNKLVKIGKIKKADANNALKVMMANEKSPERREYGFIAQDVKAIFPELVFEDSDGYLSINYNGLIPVLVEALKEQKQIVENQSAEIKKLKNILNNK